MISRETIKILFNFCPVWGDLELTRDRVSEVIYNLGFTPDTDEKRLKIDDNYLGSFYFDTNRSDIVLHGNNVEVVWDAN